MSAICLALYLFSAFTIFVFLYLDWLEDINDVVFFKFTLYVFHLT